MEFAGIALAVFPLAIKGMGIYLDAVSKIKDTYRYQQILKQWIRNLEMEQCKLENTLQILLGENFRHRGTQLENILNQTLRSDKEVRVFIETMDSLDEKLKEICKAFQLDDGYGLGNTVIKVKKRQWNKFKVILEQQKYINIRNEIRNANDDLARIAIPITASIIQKRLQSTTVHSYNRMRNYAIWLHDIFILSFQQAVCGCTSSHVVSLQLRKTPPRAQDAKLRVLFEMIGQKTLGYWKFLDFEPVEVEKATIPEPQYLSSQKTWSLHQNLRLDEPSLLVTNLRSPSPRPFSVGAFRDTFSAIVSNAFGRMRTSSGPEVGTTCSYNSEREESSPCNPLRKVDACEDRPSTYSRIPTVPPDYPRIPNFCSTVFTTTNGKIEPCLGLLLHEDHTCSWRVWSYPLQRNDMLQSALPKTTTLHEILIPNFIDTKSRLKLGVDLASAAMQLHTSAWLDERWGSRDVHFLRDGGIQKKLPDGQWKAAPLLETPFIQDDFGNPSPEIHPPSKTGGFVACDKTIFSLGIVLIELCLEKPIEELGVTDETFDNHNAYYNIASRLMGDIFRLAGERYGVAVARCINGMDGNTSQSASLEDEGFKGDVLTNVMGLLEDNLEEFLKAYN
ncbi:hypothetical protein EDC01DRAFT_412916 [Geopyxis carbonaria]|nr:hypothetical protein EDC01DRAFT_412916 [Geopyxis carbonaria]